MEFSILKINGRSVGPSEAMAALRRTEDPVAVEIVRRCGRNTDEPSAAAAAAAAALYLPGDCSILIGGSGGLCTTGTSGSELSCCCTCPPARHPSSSRSVGVQTALSATEMIASAAILAASRAAEEARIALGIPVIGGYHHSPLSLRDPIIGGQLAKEVGEIDEGDGEDDDDDGDEEVEEEGAGDDDDEEEVLFGDPTFLNRCRPPGDPLSEEVNQIESTYANFPDYPERTTGLGSEFSTGSKPESNSCDTQDSQPPELSEILGGAPLEWTYFNVLLQRNSPNEKFGLTLVYRPSCLQSNSTEVYVGEIEEGSVSERSGLISTGDRIVKINDQEIESREHVIELFAECCQNAKISLMRPRRSGSYRPMPPPSYPLLGGSLPLTKEAELRSDFRGRVSDPKMTTNAYAHLPDQDSGMGRTTDESVRTAESSEQEGESDPGCKLANATDKLNWTALTTGGFLGSDHEPKENNGSHSGAVNGNAKKAGIKSQKKDLVDAELVRLSHLMQSLALHCSNLAYVKRLYSSALQRDNNQQCQETTPQTAPFTAAVRPPDIPSNTAAPTPAASAFLPPRCTPRMGTRREGSGPAGGLQRAGKANSEGWFNPAAPTDSNMGVETVQASNCEKTPRVETCSTSSSTSAMALPSLSDGQRLCATDIISPDLATSLPTLANSTAPAAVDLAADSSGLPSRLSMGRGPSSIWSLPEPTGPFSEESLLPRLGAPPPRFPFPRTGATTANASPSQVKIASRRLTNRSCERVGQVKLASEASDSNNSLVGSNLKSLSGQGSCSGDSGRGFYPRQHPNSPIKHGCISTTVSLSSGGHQYSNNLASLPQSPQHHPPPPPYYTSSSDVPVAKPRPSECQSPPCPPPPLPYPPLQPIAPASSPFWYPRDLHNLGPAPLFPFPPPLGLHPYELYDHFFLRAAHPSTINDPNHVSATQDGPTEECKYSDVLSNIYETPYAYADMVDTAKDDVGKDCIGVATAVSSGANEQMSSLYNLPGGVFPHNWYEGHAVGAPSLVGVGNPGYTHHPGLTPVTGGATSPAAPPPLMEWVVKKRTDGTRYITRRPIRNKSTRTRSRHQVEERCGLTTDDDAQSELKFGRYWNRIERKKHVEKAKVERRRRPGAAGVADEASEQSRDPTNSKSSSRSQNSTDRCLVSLTTV